MSNPPARLAFIVRRCLAFYLEANPALRLPLDEKAARRELDKLARHNFETGRYDRFRKHPRAPARLTPTRYVEHLVGGWVQEAGFFYRLCEQDPDCWNELRHSLIHSAASVLGKFPSSETGEDYAQRACAQILLADYPFDVPFMWWACTIAQNMVHARARSKNRFNDQALSLDASIHSDSDGLPMGWQISDPISEFFTEAIQERDLVERVLRRLNEPRRIVILLSYFEEWDDLMIGKTLGIKPANVQTLRHRALDQLAGFLGANPMTVNRQRRHRIDKKRSVRRKKHEPRAQKT